MRAYVALVREQVRSAPACADVCSRMLTDAHVCSRMQATAMAAATRTLLRRLSQREPSSPSSSSSSSSFSSSTSKEEEKEEEDTHVGGRGERDAGGLDRRSQAVRGVQDEVC